MPTISISIVTSDKCNTFGVFCLKTPDSKCHFTVNLSCIVWVIMTIFLRSQPSHDITSDTDCVDNNNSPKSGKEHPLNLRSNL